MGPDLGMQQRLQLRQSMLIPKQREGDVGKALLPGSDSGGERPPVTREKEGPLGEPGRPLFHASSTLPFGFETKPKNWDEASLKEGIFEKRL